MLVVILTRLLLNNLILRYPLAGAFLAIFLDYHDLNFLMLYDQESMGNYQYWEKALDLHYLALEVYVALTWKNILVKYTAWGLFMYRLVGTLAFEVTQNSLFLVIFPNVFEYFYLFYLIHLRLFKKDHLTSAKAVIITVVILLLPKLLHEYLLHINTTHPWQNNKYIKPIWDRLLLDF